MIVPSRRQWMRSVAAGLGAAFLPERWRTPVTSADAAESGDAAGTNWAGNVAYSAKGLYRPATIAEVQRTIRENEKVKPLGGRHSLTPRPATRRPLISRERL